MQTLKNVFLTVGIISILLFLVLLIIGVKVVSTVFFYIVGALAVISLIGIIIFYVGKMSGKSDD
ncbi:MAG TPA: hypothetical protein DIT04_14370 [Dysgonomonas sp.]|nr:hypothetical protein [Dysgonomonas sp.]